jgi:methylenetetrahydrofolate--tRNA-(uracil-5-)-methyltransferase
MWNLVGFQTRLRIGEQGRVFRLIPGLEDAEFLRWGSIHRNSYLNFPARLASHGGLPDEPELLFAGQLTGVEGYTESIASGLIAAIQLDRLMQDEAPVLPPEETMLGGLYRYLREADPEHFQPMNANFGLLDVPPGHARGKRARRVAQSARALEAIRAWCVEVGREPRPLPEGLLGTPGS